MSHDTAGMVHLPTSLSSNPYHFDPIKHKKNADSTDQRCPVHISESLFLDTNVTFVGKAMLSATNPALGQCRIHLQQM